MKYITTLTIAGSDASGGAGIQADLKTFAALSCYGMSIITALTAQNTLGVQSIFSISPRFVAEQMKSILSDIRVDAIKIGMLHSKKIVEVVAKMLPVHVPVVLDPVMIAKGGSALLKEDAIEAMRVSLFPRVDLITPNLPEAERFLGYKVESERQMQRVAEDFCQLGVRAVLLKGGHLKTELITDCLYLNNKKRIYWFPKTKIKTKNTHGTGCTLSAAITAFLARNNNIIEAVTLAEDYLYRAIAAGKYFKLGQGCGPVYHSF